MATLHLNKRTREACGVDEARPILWPVVSVDGDALHMELVPLGKPRTQSIDEKPLLSGDALEARIVENARLLASMRTRKQAA